VWPDPILVGLEPGERPRPQPSSLALFLLVSSTINGGAIRAIAPDLLNGAIFFLVTLLADTTVVNLSVDCCFRETFAAFLTHMHFVT